MQIKGNAGKKSRTPSYLGTEGREINRRGNKALNNKNILVLSGRKIIRTIPIIKGTNMTRGIVMAVKTKG
jgi:hypothetical protein